MADSKEVKRVLLGPLFDNNPIALHIGGGNVHQFTTLPEHVRRGDNDKAFLGGIRIWGNNL